MRNIVVLDAPSNLGLRPPAPGTVPGCHKLAGALREQRIVQRLHALEGGVVVPPDRVERHVRAGDFPVVLGGDCSVQLGASLALRRVGRYGLAAIGGTSHALQAVGEPRRTSGTPATPTGSARRAVRRSRWAPGADRRT
jgi:hypothetical protein